MSIRTFHLPTIVALAATLAAGLLCSPAAEGVAEKEGLSVTNAPRRTHHSLQQLEEDLSKSLQILTPKNSLDGVVAPAPPPRIVLPARKAREDEKNKLKLTPEDLTRDLNSSELFRVEGESPRKTRDLRKNSMEEFYRQLETTSASSTGKRDPFGLEHSMDRDRQSQKEENTPSGIRDSERKLRKALGDNDTAGKIFGGEGQRSSFADFFGLGDRTLSTAEIQAHKNYLEEYQKLLDRAPSVSSAGVGSPADFSRRNATWASGGNDPYMTPVSRTPEITPGNVNAFLNPQPVQDLNASTLNAWNPMWTPPQPELPKRIAPAPTVTEAPRRKF